jgi:hypothetical protein
MAVSMRRIDLKACSCWSEDGYKSLKLFQYERPYDEYREYRKKGAQFGPGSNVFQRLCDQVTL